jgi:hypothetical protein
VPIRFRLLRGGQIVLPISVDGRPMRAILDTGSTLNDMPRALFRVSGLKADQPEDIRSTTGHGIGARTFKSELYRFRTAVIGGVTIDHPVFGVGGAAPAGSLALIGDSFIRQHEIYISYATRTLYIRGADRNRAAR